MTITFRNRSGDLLAEVDSDTIFSERIKATFHACPVCERTPVMGRDSGRWYLVGTPDCFVCRGTYALPNEEELADMIRRNQ